MDEVMKNELDEVLNEAIDGLPSPLGIILRLRIMDRKTLKEVGKMLGISIDRVRSKESKAMRMLRHPYRIRKIAEAWKGEIF
jgi:RNA polymerase sigma factor (sigma-70 family)